MRYNVYLWCGAGYSLTPFKNIEAESESDALEIAVVQAEQRGLVGLFWDEVEDLEELEESGAVLYVDATLHGAAGVHYIDATNARIEESRS